MKKLVFILLFALIEQQSHAAEIYIYKKINKQPPPNQLLELQIVQGALPLNNNTVKNALIAHGENGRFVGIEIELKPAAAKLMAEMSLAGMNKSLNLVMNNKIINSTVIRSAIGYKFLITSISQSEAEGFLRTLNYHKSHPGSQ